MNKLFGVLALIAAVLGGALVIGVQRFAPRQIDVARAAPIQIDVDAAAQRLSRAIRHRTVAPVDLASQAEFERFHAFLTESFPELHKRLARETVNQHSLLYTWQGTRTELKPILLLAHMDVMPANAEDSPRWRHAPFSGELADGQIWGRGALDDKASLLALLEAVEHLLREGFQPQRTVYLAFGHDEELGGNNGAARIAATLAARTVQLEYVLDEGLNISDGIVAQIARPVALIGIAEKGYLTLELSVTAPGGHASAPPSQTAIGILSGAIDRLERNPPPARLTGATGSMLEFLGPEMPWHLRAAVANLWLLGPLVTRALTKNHLTAATLRTTLAPTVFTSGLAENALPAQARALINLRLLPGDSVAAMTEHVRRTIADSRVKTTALPNASEASAISEITAPSFELLQRTIRQIAPEALVAPGLLVASTDSRHYAGLSKNIYRFLPITLRPEDVQRYHGTNERISIQDYERCIRFYAQLMRQS